MSSSGWRSPAPWSTILGADRRRAHRQSRRAGHPGIFQLLQQINGGGTVVVMATHNLALVRDTGYRVIELKGGSIVYDSGLEAAAGAKPLRLPGRMSERSAPSAAHPSCRCSRSRPSAFRSSPSVCSAWWR